MLVVMAGASVAWACGVPGVGGPAGVTTTCNLKDRPRTAEAIVERLATGFSFSSTRIRFPGGDYAAQRSAVLVSAERTLRHDMSLTLSAGLVVDGWLTGASVYRFAPSAIVAGTFSWRALANDGGIPFIVLAGTLSHTAGSVYGNGVSRQYAAFDLRAGISIGWTLWRVWSPYALARAFGGPVFFQDQIGSDAYHYQVGAGFVLKPHERFDLYVEGVPLGERGVTAGLGFTL
jgi:hypothetical protein